MIIREVTIPLRLVSLTNQREHWAKKAKRAKEQRGLARMALGRFTRELPIEVTLTRVAPRELDDDNLRAACKSVRDGVADWYGTDDRNPSIEWRYEQKRGKPREYACVIRIERKEVAA